MKIIKVSVPGKLHLLGEHAVVYGKPALLAAVNKRCFVELIPRKDKMIEIKIKDLNLIKKTTEKQIINKTKQADKIWSIFSGTNNFSILKKIIEDPTDYILLTIGKTLSILNKSFSTGFTLIITSEIPQSSGMGSSAAAAVAIAGAITLFLGEELEKEKINLIAFLTEHFIHGFPSGGDTSISCYGGLLWFRRELQDLKIIQPLTLTLSDKISNNFFIINTGQPKESTGEMVSLVKIFVGKHKNLAQKIFIDQENLTRNLLQAIEDKDDEGIINCIKNGEKNLEKLGVVSLSVKKIIREIEKSGGAAKICGGGGKKRATGVILVYHQNKKTLEKIAQEKKLSLEKISLGEGGIKIDEK